MMRRSTLRQLQIFAAVAKHRSFTRAAEELFLTQSSVSTQLKHLKELVGYPLIEQIGKKITITPIGMRTLQLYTDLDIRWRDYEKDIAQLTNPEQGEISISAVKSCQYFLPRIIGIFCQTYPYINISLKVVNREDINQRISKNLDDFYITGIPPSELDLKTVPFIENPLLIIAPPGHHLAHETRLPIKILENEKFLVREPGSGTRCEANDFFDRHDLTVDAQIELGSNEAIKQGVMGGLGISIISLYGVALELRLGLLTSLDIEGFPLQRNWNIVYPAGKALTPSTRTFIDFLKADGKTIAREGIDKSYLSKRISHAREHIVA